MEKARRLLAETLARFAQALQDRVGAALGRGAIRNHEFDLPARVPATESGSCCAGCCSGETRRAFAAVAA